MKTLQDFETEEVIYFAFMLVQCFNFLLLLSIWCLIPKWRTLQHFIGLCQICVGTMHSVLGCVNDLVDFNIPIEFMDYLILHVCCSQCSVIIAHVKLVFVNVGRITGEKRKVAVFICGVFVLIKIVHAISFIFIKGYFIFRFTKLIVGGFSIGIIIILNLVMYFNIIISVFSSKMRRPSLTQVVSLIGVAIMCDLSLIINWGLFMSHHYVCYTNAYMVNVFNTDSACNSMYCVILYTRLRMLPLVVFFLFKRSTRDLVTHYCRQKFNVWRARNATLN